MGASLKQLRYFEAVARLGHFGRAAEHCAVTQPALSMQVQELERQLGAALFERRRQGVTLTRAGEEVLSRARRILAEMRALEDVAKSCVEPLTGALKLGVIPTIAPYLLPRILTRARRDFPALTLAVRETQTKVLLDELEQGLLDVLLVALPIDQRGVHCEPLFDDRFFLARPAVEAEAEAPVLATLDMLRDARVLLLEEGHCFRDQALSLCHRPGGEAVDTLGASSLTTIVQMVSSGMGVTLLPEMSIPVEARDGGIRLARFESPEPARSIGLAWRESSPRAIEFLQLGTLIFQAASEQREALSSSTPNK